MLEDPTSVCRVPRVGRSEELCQVTITKHLFFQELFQMCFTEGVFPQRRLCFLLSRQWSEKWLLVWASQVKESPDYLWGVVGHCSILGLLMLDLWLTCSISTELYSELENGFSLCARDVLVRRRSSARQHFAIMWKGVLPYRKNITFSLASLFSNIWNYVLEECDL